MKAVLIIRALYQGAQLSKVETWKKVSVATAAMTSLLSAFAGLAISFGWLENVDPQTIMEASSALVTLISLVLAYFQVATTEKIGIKPKSGTSIDKKTKSDADRALHQWSGID